MKLKNEETQIEEVKEDVVVKATKPKKSAEQTLDQKIESWKAQYGRVYQNTIDEEVVIWRAVKRSEYRELLKMNESLDDEERLLAKQEATVKMVTLYPSNIEELIEQKGGLATVLSEEILAKSGFDMSVTKAL